MKKVATPHFYISPPPFSGLPPFVAKNVIPSPHLTQFLEGPTPPPLIGEGGFNYVILFANLTMESRDPINEGKTDLWVLLEKQDSQFRVLTEVLKDSVSKHSKSIDEKIDNLYSTHTSGEPDDLNRDSLETHTPSSDPEGRACKVARQSEKK